MQIQIIRMYLSSKTELDHYCLVFENTIYKPLDCVINTQEKKFQLTLKLEL